MYETLTKILELKNFGKIKKAIQKQGYEKASKYKDLRDISLIDILAGFTVEPPPTISKDKRYKFSLSYHNKVKHAFNYKFIWLERVKYSKILKAYMPNKLRLYAKVDKD